MNNIIIQGGATEIRETELICDICETNIRDGIKNIRLIPSPKWRFCIIKISNIPYKYIYADELPLDRPYMIELALRQQLPSLLCDKMILFQQKNWFKFTVEFIMHE